MGKSDIPAGSNENVRTKIVDPIIQCSPDLTRVIIMSNDVERKCLNENKAYLDKYFAITFVGYLLFDYNFKQRAIYDAN